MEITLCDQKTMIFVMTNYNKHSKCDGEKAQFQVGTTDINT